MDTYAADVAEIAKALHLRGAVHIGHSTGGGEVGRYAARAEHGRVAKALLIGAAPSVMVASAADPDGIPLEVFVWPRRSRFDVGERPRSPLPSFQVR